MNQRPSLPYPLFFVGMAVILAIGSVIGLIKGGLLPFAYGLVTVAMALFFSTFVLDGKLDIATDKMDTAAGSLNSLFGSNPFTNTIMKFDSMILWCYLALDAYSTIRINTIIEKIPILNIANEILDSLENFLFYLALIALLTIFSRKAYSTLAAGVGIFLAIEIVYWLWSYVEGIFKEYYEYSFFYGVPLIMILAYAFILFLPYLNKKPDQI